jgi:glutamine synthetase
VRPQASAFYDPQGYGLLSRTALQYVGGLLAHGPAVLALTNPSTNSYRRLVPGYEAPILAFFSAGNRTAAVRIPRYATKPEKVRIEFRPPDATCNIYLALGPTAGGAGRHPTGDRPHRAGFGPIEADVFSWSEERRAAIRPLPTALSDALDALEADHKFLCEGEVFSEDLLSRWVAARREEELAVRVRPHPYEVKLYYDV